MIISPEPMSVQEGAKYYALQLSDDVDDDTRLHYIECNSPEPYRIHVSPKISCRGRVLESPVPDASIIIKDGRPIIIESEGNAIHVIQLPVDENDTDIVISSVKPRPSVYLQLQHVEDLESSLFVSHFRRTILLLLTLPSDTVAFNVDVWHVRRTEDHELRVPARVTGMLTDKWSLTCQSPYWFEGGE